MAIRNGVLSIFSGWGDRLCGVKGGEASQMISKKVILPTLAVLAIAWALAVGVRRVQAQGIKMDFSGLVQMMDR